MLLKEENRYTRRKTFPSTTLSTTNLTRTDLRSKPELRGVAPATSRLGHGTSKTKINLRIIFNDSVLTEQ